MEQRELIRATPAARALARRMGVKLANVTGTGYKGRIHSDDVAGWNYKGKIHISPLAQRIADEHNIDISGLKGTGHNEKIMKDDVLTLISDPKLKERFTQNDLLEVPAPKADTKKQDDVKNNTEKDENVEKPTKKLSYAGIKMIGNKWYSIKDNYKKSFATADECAKHFN